MLSEAKPGSTKMLWIPFKIFARGTPVFSETFLCSSTHKFVIIIHILYTGKYIGLSRQATDNLHYVLISNQHKIGRHMCYSWQTYKGKVPSN